jgi:hypothetical protein
VPHVLAWDWEYWDDCVPVGFDELHYHFGTCFFRAQASLPDSYTAMRTRAESVLSELGLEARERELVVALYLVEFLLRRLEIAAAGGGADDVRVFPDLFVVGFDALARVSAAASAV